mgnify:CR=1 FL=1
MGFLKLLQVTMYIKKWLSLGFFCKKQSVKNVFVLPVLVGAFTRATISYTSTLATIKKGAHCCGCTCYNSTPCSTSSVISLITPLHFGQV